MLFSIYIPVYFQSQDDGFTLAGLGRRRIRGEFVYISKNT